MDPAQLKAQITHTDLNVEAHTKASIWRTLFTLGLTHPQLTLQQELDLGVVKYMKQLDGPAAQRFHTLSLIEGTLSRMSPGRENPEAADIGVVLRYACRNDNDPSCRAKALSILHAAQASLPEGDDRSNVRLFDEAFSDESRTVRAEAIKLFGKEYPRQVRMALRDGERTVAIQAASTMAQAENFRFDSDAQGIVLSFLEHHCPKLSGREWYEVQEPFKAIVALIPARDYVTSFLAETLQNPQVPEGFQILVLKQMGWEFYRMRNELRKQAREDTGPLRELAPDLVSALEGYSNFRGYFHVIHETLTSLTQIAGSGVALEASRARDRMLEVMDELNAMEPVGSLDGIVW